MQILARCMATLGAFNVNRSKWNASRSETKNIFSNKFVLIQTKFKILLLNPNVVVMNGFNVSSWQRKIAINVLLDQYSVH